MPEVIIQHTSPIDGDSFVYDDDSVITDGSLNSNAVVVHDGEAIRVDLQATGAYQVNPPYFVEIRHKYFEGAWAGWGWRAEINGASENRNPDARAIGVYSDPGCTAYLYTTGAFVEGASEWQQEWAWATETPPGRATADKGQWNLALLFGSAQEDHGSLLPEDDAVTFPYFDNATAGQ